MISVTWVSCSSSPDILTVSNTSATDWSNKNIVVSSSQLNVKSELLPVIFNSEGIQVPSQADDINGDGKWNELAFQVSLPAGSSKEFMIEGVYPNEYPKFKKKTQVHLGYSPQRNDRFESVDQNIRPKDHRAQSTPYLYQYEGPGWESNLVAYRSYFDSRNGKDIFGKRTEDMVTESIGINEDYHTLQPWGMDILKVGNSLGAGALALKKDGKLIRLGETKSAKFKKIYEGPVRSFFQLEYEGWDVAGQPYELTEVITIWANKRWYNSTVHLSANTSDTLVTGIVNLFDMQATTIDTSNFEMIYTYGQQSEHGDALGMAILVPENNSIGFSKAPTSGNGITNTELVYLQPENDSYTFYFYSGWQGEQERFSDLNYFESEIIREAKQLSIDPVIQSN